MDSLKATEKKLRDQIEEVYQNQQISKSQLEEKLTEQIKEYDQANENLKTQI